MFFTDDECAALSAGGRQRTDSTHVLAAIRSLNRVELGRETMRHTVTILAQLAPSWLRQHSQPEWLERYGERLDAGRLAKTEQAYQALAEQIGRDGRALLTAIDEPGAPGYLREIEAVQTLRAIWAQQDQQDHEATRLRGCVELPPAADLLCSPYEHDARYSIKRNHLPRRPSLWDAHARYRGHANVHLQHLVTASALNLARVAAWLAHTPRSGTRQSPFTQLMALPT